MPTGGIIGIIVGVLALFILAIAFLVWFVSTQIDDVIGDGSFEEEDYYSDTIYGPLVEGERSTPVAEEPLECAEPCFDGDPAEAAALTDAEADRLGLLIDETFIPSSTPHIDSIVAEREWLVSGATPHSCAFTSPKAPLSTTTDPSTPWYNEESIHYNVATFDEDYMSSIEQSVRYFATSAEATAHLATMDSEIDACTAYSIDYFDPNDAVGEGYTEEWDVTRAPALDLPASVAAVGWVETGEWDRSYTFDLQRGNVVVRTTLESSVDLSEKQFRALVESMAERVASVPVG